MVKDDVVKAFAEKFAGNFLFMTSEKKNEITANDTFWIRISGRSFKFKPFSDNVKLTVEDAATIAKLVGERSYTRLQKAYSLMDLERWKESAETGRSESPDEFITSTIAAFVNCGPIDWEIPSGIEAGFTFRGTKTIAPLRGTETKDIELLRSAIKGMGATVNSTYMK